MPTPAMGTVVTEDVSATSRPPGELSFEQMMNPVPRAPSEMPPPLPPLRSVTPPSLPSLPPGADPIPEGEDDAA
jgi:hypothetical protein